MKTFVTAAALIILAGSILASSIILAAAIRQPASPPAGRFDEFLDQPAPQNNIKTLIHFKVPISDAAQLVRYPAESGGRFDDFLDAPGCGGAFNITATQ